jgi:hypothetical protein
MKLLIDPTQVEPSGHASRPPMSHVRRYMARPPMGHVRRGVTRAVPERKPG